LEKELKEMLGLILTKLDGLELRMDRLESRMDNLELRMERLESKVDKLELRMESLESKVDKVELRTERLESKVDKLESRTQRLESRQDETFLVAKAIEHNNLVRGAEIDNLKFKVSHTEGTINAVGDVLTTRKAI